MHINLLVPLQAVARPKNQFALFFVGSFTAKLLHLGSHFASLPIVLYILYLPTFLLPDFLLLVGSKVLVYRLNGGRFATARKVLGGILAIFTVLCAAAQISFFVETGGEIQWMAAGRVVGGSGGLGLLLSGLPPLIIAFCILYAIALVITPTFYDSVGKCLEMVWGSYHHSYALFKRSWIGTKSMEEDILLLTFDQEHAAASPTSEVPREPVKRVQSTATAVSITIATIGAGILVLVLQFLQPITPPYAHMSGSLPVTIIEAAWFSPTNSEFCLRHPIDVVPFPFEQFAKFYDSPQSDNWLPRSQGCREQNEAGPPPWQEPLEDGPGRQIPHKSGCEPLKLSNLDAELVGDLAEQMGSKKPVIKNVLFLTLESTRKDVFPLLKNSHPHTTIQESYSHQNIPTHLDEKLANFGSAASFLTGQPSGFEAPDKIIPENNWRTSFRDGMGAININGAITQASWTFKSLLSSHCGVEPLAVDYTDEVRGHMYQPCLPHILQKMSSAGASAAATNASHWSSTLVQSVTDQFDSQDLLNAQMGFKNVVVESNISNPDSKYYPPKEPWVNYFGYPEPETLPYLRDLFADGVSKRRQFVSHVTSTPHHAFRTPRDWAGKTTYMASARWRKKDPFDDYLNTIQYQDEWIEQVFQMLHDTGALAETLVVITGDHGFAFTSLDASQSVVENGHVANFEIPLLFVHPDLPRLQISASTTPLSIIPTVLDLMLQSNSFTGTAAEIAREVLPTYQGNSLVRDLNFSLPNTAANPAPAFFAPWHFSVTNAGGSLLVISDAATTFRLIMPLCAAVPLRFTDISTDPHEKAPITAWTMDELGSVVERRHGARAVEWARLASELGRWWVWEQRGKWRYWGNARETGRSGPGIGGIGGERGRIKKSHWWET